MADTSLSAPARTLPYWEFVAMMACLMALNAASIDVFIPAAQQIGDALGVTDENQRQFVISSYMFGFGISQLFFGTLSDRFGRRPVLFGGLAVFVLTSIAAILSPTFTILLVLRFIQGVGAAATRVIAVSVVRDTYGGARMASVMSLVMMVFMVVPILAPNFGQLIMLFGDWQEVFLVVGGFGLFVTVWAFFRLPETLHPEYRLPLTFSRVAGAFRTVVTNRRAFGYTLASGFAFGSLFGFVNSAQQVFTQVYVLGDMFTLAFSACAAFMALASFTNSQLVERIGMRRLSHGAVTVFLMVALTGLVSAWAWGGAMPFPFYMGLMIVGFGALGFVGTNFQALALEPLGRVAGTASSVLGFMQTFLAGLLGATIGYFFDGTVIPLFTGFLVLSSAALACVAVGERGALFARDSAEG